MLSVASIQVTLHLALQEPFLRTSLDVALKKMVDTQKNVSTIFFL